MRFISDDIEDLVGYPADDFTGAVRRYGSLIFALSAEDRALRQCQRWRARGHELTVAVNVSVRNLIDARFPDDVQRLLRERDVPAALLKLEITETAIVSDPYRCKTVLDRLAEMGIRLAVDDFGTGYTSLGYLRRLPINELKIDRSFVANMLDSEDDAVIVRSTIDLGQNLGLQVVAEGRRERGRAGRPRDTRLRWRAGLPCQPSGRGRKVDEWLERLPVTAAGPQWPAEPSPDGPVGVGYGQLN
jgi:predicted signal transduction protein with EAL and GGDEF domain